MVSFIFFGTSENSIIVLDRLIKAGYQCSTIVTIPDKPVGRKQILTPSPVKSFAQKNKIPVFSVSNLSDLSNLSNLGDLGSTTNDQRPKAKFAIVADFGLLIPPELIKAFPKGILNLHPSLLPAYQGATPAPFQILRGEKEGGVTVITINEKFDQGAILAQTSFPLTKSWTAVDLLVHSFSLGASLLIKILPDYLAGKLKPVPQDLSKKSYFPRLSRDDGFITWIVLIKAMKGDSITESEKPRFMKIAQISKLYIVNYKLYIALATRAFTPWPDVWTEINIKGQLKRLKLLKSHIEKGKLILDEVQLEGKNPVSFSQFQKAYPLP